MLKKSIIVCVAALGALLPRSSPTAVADRDNNIYNGMNSTYNSSLNRVTLTHN